MSATSWGRSRPARLSFRAGAWRSASRGLYHRAEAQLLAERVGDAIGFGGMFGQIPAVLLGDLLAHAANVGDSGLVRRAAARGCVHGDSPYNIKSGVTISGSR